MFSTRELCLHCRIGTTQCSERLKQQDTAGAFPCCRSLLLQRRKAPAVRKVAVEMGRGSLGEKRACRICTVTHTCTLQARLYPACQTPASLATLHAREALRVCTLHASQGTGQYVAGAASRTKVPFSFLKTGLV